MERNVEVQNAPTGIFDNEEAVQRAEIKVGNGEEIERSNHFTMVVQKRVPLAGFVFVWNPLQLLQVARYVTITLMLLSSSFTRFGHISKLLIPEVTGVLMTDRGFSPVEYSFSRRN